MKRVLSVLLTLFLLVGLCVPAFAAGSDPQQAADERIRYDNFKSEARMLRETPPDGRVIDTSEVL